MLREVYRISKFDWPFTKALEHLAGKFPIRDMWNRSVDRETYARRHMAPKMVALINSYFSNRRVQDVDVSIVKKIIDKCIDMVNLGGNADAIIRHALDQSGLYHQTTEAVTWGGILRAIMDGDVDEILETIEYFSKRERRTRDDWDHDVDDDMKKYRVHVGTSFGRGVSADF